MALGQKEESRGKPYTAIIYFHGIGTQKRYEEISRLIDGLDQYSFYASSDRLGNLRKQHHEIEPGREGMPDDVEYISAQRIAKGRSGLLEGKGLFRIYEAYWSHTLVGGYSGLRVFLWMIGRMINPFGAIFQAWRSQPRLKLARLYRMYNHSDQQSPTGPYRRLENIYHDFENWPARRKYRYGSFREFLRYVGERQGSSTRNIETRIARRWRLVFLSEQLIMLFISATLLCAFLEFLGIGVTLLYKAASFFKAEFVGEYSSFDRIGWTRSVLYIGASVVLTYILVRANSFLSMYLADVMFWTNEKDSRYLRREEILKAASLTVRHVLADPKCKRVVIVAHSLGSAIAYETLLSLGRARRARRGRPDLPASLTALGKITDFVTLGSPIQLVSTLFERRTSQYHRYNRIVDARRASTDDDPFLRGKGVRWVNVSDPADPISSSIFSVRGRLPNNLAIHEWRTASGHISMPLSAHSGYFRSKDVLNLLFSVCITRQSASRSEWHSAPATSKFLRTTGARVAWLLCAGAVWLLAMYLCAEAVGYGTVSALSTAVGAIIMVGLTGLVAFGRLADRRWPLEIGMGVDSKAAYDDIKQ